LTPIVSVIQTENTSRGGIKNAVNEAINRSEFKLPKKLNSVILKVNLRYYWDSSTGETTDPRVAAAVIGFLQEHCDRDVDIIVAEADASAMRTKYAFKMLGYEKMTREKKVKLVNLSSCKMIEKRTTVNGNEFVLPIAKLMQDADLLINIPKLRTHRLTTVSCSLKNLFGAIAVPRKVVYHPRLDQVIVAINKILKANLTVVDGIIALGKEPIKLGLILASEDQLAVDFVAARVMGYDPTKLQHLMLARKEGVGSTTNLQVIGEKDLRKFANSFSRENYSVFNFLWRVKLYLLSLYLKITGDTRPPVLDR